MQVIQGFLSSEKRKMIKSIVQIDVFNYNCIVEVHVVLFPSLLFAFCL
jgi:hypothetical protein